MEDLWDDADEVLGPLIDRGESITFSTEPHQWLADTRSTPLPDAEPGVQLALSMAFTNEKALNLRAIVTAYQDGPEYGRLVVLTVPKGHFVPGPEQADAAIDQDPALSQYFSWWNRLGNDVIRGHTSTILVGNEVLYIEPIFTRSQQNPSPQIKSVAAVVRGSARVGATLAEALQTAPTSAPLLDLAVQREPVPAIPADGRALDGANGTSGGRSAGPSGPP
jgi:uncharacterized membrane protein (UPF0182 family)